MTQVTDTNIIRFVLP